MKTSLLLACAALVAGSLSVSSAVTVDNFVPRSFTNAQGRLPYRLFIPTNYNPAVKLPIVLFLHGAGERGSDNRLQLTGQTGPLVFASETNQLKHPSFMVAPQCPSGGWWADATRRAQVLGMMEALLAEFSIDPDRVYITGLSMGGYGTWDYIARYPGMYAAAVPMNGGGSTSLAAAITRMPIWNFHARDDGVVPVSESRVMVQAVRRAGGNVIYTEYAGGGHGIWTPAYRTPILMEWVYSQRRGAFSSAPPLLRIDQPVEQGVYAVNGTNIALSGSATDGTNGVKSVNWTNYASVSISFGPAQGTNAWAISNIVVATSVTNMLLVTAQGASWYAPFGGFTTFNDTLAVIVPPAISLQPENVAVNEGDMATFSVLVPPHVNKPVYQWFRQGEPLPGATGSSLTLSDVQFAQAGTYAVRITNAFGSVLSSNAVLEVNRHPIARCRPAVVEAGMGCVAQATVDDGSSDPDGNPITVLQVPEGPYPAGTNLVTLIVVDSRGASNTCSAAVIVLDRTPPQVVCPADILVTNAHGQATTSVAFAPTATDNCGSVLSLTCNPASGSAFGVGTHSVACEAIDNSGNASRCTFHVTVLPGNQPPVPSIEVSPLARFPGWTNLIVIAPNGLSAAVSFDASDSADPDDATFGVQWFEETNCFSTNILAVRNLGVGSHEITLNLDDTFPGGTSSSNVVIEVITPSEAVVILVSLLEESDLARNVRQPLMASLGASSASFARRQFTAGGNQLGAFQHKVLAQVAPIDAHLAESLIHSAQVIIDAVRR